MKKRNVMNDRRGSNGYRWLALATALVVVGAAHAGDPRIAQDSRTAFKSFAQPLIGSWDCNLRTWEDRFHERMVETPQKRRFEWVLKGNFLQESVYAVLRNGEMVHVGLNMISVDPETTHILLSGFDTTTADRRVTLDGELAPDLRHLTGRVQLLPATEGAEAPRRLEWQWLDDNRTSARTYARAPNGREFLNTELICKRPDGSAEAKNNW